MPIKRERIPPQRNNNSTGAVVDPYEGFVIEDHVKLSNTMTLIFFTLLIPLIISLNIDTLNINQIDSFILFLLV